MSPGQNSLANLHSKLIIIYFCVFPLLYLPGTFEIYALRESVFFLLTGVLLISFALSNHYLPLKTNCIDKILIVAFLVRFTSWCIATVNTQSIFPLIGMHNLIFELTILTFYLQIRRLKSNQYSLDLIARWFLGTSLIICLASYFAPPISLNSEQGRWQAMFFHPNFLGMFTVCILTISPKLKLGWKVSGVIMILLSGSRIALILLILLLLIRRYWLTCLGIIVIGILFLAWRTTHYPVESFRIKGTQALEMRKEIYAGSVRTILHNPYGTGPQIFGPKVHQYLSPKFHKLFPNPIEHSIYKAHSSLLEWTAESGWIIPLLFLSGCITLLMIPSSTSRTSTILLLIGSLVSVILNYPSGLILLTYLLAISISNQSNSHSNVAEDKAIYQGIKPLSIVIRMLFPLLFGIFIFLYGILNLRMHIVLPQIIDDLNSGEVESAWVKLDKQLDLPQLQLNLLYYYFRISTLAGRNNDVINYFTKHFPAWVDISYQVSLVNLQNGKLDLALKYIEQSIDFHPFWPQNYLLKATILNRLNLKNEALQAFEKAKKLQSYGRNFRNRN